MLIIKYLFIYIMADIALMMAAAGGLYIISNRDNKYNKEGFIGDEQDNGSVYQKQINKPYKLDTLANNKSQVPDNLFKVKDIKNNNSCQMSAISMANRKENNQENVPVQSITTLAGTLISSKDFTHNGEKNAGGIVKGGYNKFHDNGSAILDNTVGSGTHTIKKTGDVAPLFQPHKDLQYSHGAPNVSDFMMERQEANVGNRMANVKPWEEINVPPGLDKGYTTKPGPGFNSGLEARSEWQPKTVNQLRVETNPKLTFGLAGHEGPLMAPVQEPATIQTQGKVEKHLPDTYYNVGPERWFTTTGSEKAETVRSAQELHDVNRTTTTVEYYGTKKNEGNATYTTGRHEPSRRPQLSSKPISNVAASGHFMGNDTDYGKTGYQVLPNNRTTTRPSSEFGGVHGAIKAAIAPIFDILRPSRKENVIGNLRPNGNVGVTHKEGVYFDENDRPKTTIKEMAEGKLDCNHLNVQNQSATGYLVTEHQPVNLQRDSTCRSYTGNAAATDQRAMMSYSSGYAQRNNNSKTQISRLNHGNTQIYNPTENITYNKLECDRDNNRMWVPSNVPSAVPSKDIYGKLNGPEYTTQQIQSNSDRIDPELLSAFKSNPYTKSLNSWA